MPLRKLKLIGMIGLSIIVLVSSIIAPYFAPHDPLKIDVLNILIPPNDVYPLGTDHVGRCIYSRLLYGARATIGTSLILLALIASIGMVLGGIAGYRGGLIDRFITRTGDLLLAFPDIIFAIIIIGMLGPGVVNTMIALALIWWVRYAKLTRILVRKEMGREYVQAAKMAGASRLRIFTHYILPNTFPFIMVQLCLNIGTIIIALAGFSFLGLGIAPPNPEWGNMLSEGRIYIQTAPHMLIYPGFCIFVVVLLFNSLGEMLRSVLNLKE